jgi:hypothetical protein
LKWTRALAPPALFFFLGALPACSDGNTSDEEVRIGTAVSAQASATVSGDIQIDTSADLFPNIGTALNAGATLDWVLDPNKDNSGAGCLTSEGIAECIEPNVTGAPGGEGTWNGLRIIDGIAGADQNIFLQGGKENDISTWVIGPGSIGSSKYDATQAYLAANPDTLFFSMERRGTNGTTAFDFEFNAKAPGGPGCPSNLLIPCRSEHDVLFTFELQGSGNTGSVVLNVFEWDGTAYVPISVPAGTLSAINQSATPAGPWGYVNSQGDWALGDLERFALGEVLVPFGPGGLTLPGVSKCGGEAFIQLRTRSSATPNSDLKDLTRIFRLEFPSLTAEASLTPTCEGGLVFSAVATRPDGAAVPSPQCAWTFTSDSGAQLSSTDCIGQLPTVPSGTWSATVKVTDSGLQCDDTDDAENARVCPPLDATADLTAACDRTFGYDVQVAGGCDPASASVAWQFSGGGSVNPITSTTRTGTVLVGTPDVSYTGEVKVTDARTDIVCTTNDSDSAVPFAPLAINLTPDNQSLTCPGIDATGDDVTYTAHVTGGTGAFSIAWTGICAGSSMSCTIDDSEQDFCADTTHSFHAIVTDNNPLCGPRASEDETYHKVTTTTVNATDN